MKPRLPPRHFLDLSDQPAALLRQLLDDAVALKRGVRHADRLRGKTLALLFEKPSTRTRVSFEVAMRQLGGDVIVLSGPDLQRARGESIADTARVLSRYVDAIMLRTADAASLHALAQHASVPVINGLTNLSHPCQIMADILTFEELRGPIAGQTLAWVGDPNNVAATWIEAAAQFGFTLRLACPPALRPRAEVLAWARARGAIIAITDDPVQAVTAARAVITDTWVSMHDEHPEQKRAQLRPYQVTDELLSHAAPDVIFLHCLPAHRGEEVTESVIDGPHAAVWDEAENRLHAQKSILTWALG